MELKIKKVTDKIDLDVSAQGCGNDCIYWKAASARYYEALGAYSGCYKVTDARWTTWW